MNRIIITQFNNKIFFLVYENDVLVECHPIISSKGNDVQIGNIYLGRVQKKVKNINSAFISLDGENVGYLPLDDKPALVLNRKLPKGLYSIAESDLILVQVEQEPQKMKQARVTGNINLSGKYCAVDIDSGKTGLSKKITDNETRERLRALLETFILEASGNTLSENAISDSSDINNYSSHKYGYVLRTACENADDSDIRKELECLTLQMDELINKASFERRTGLLYGNKPEYITLIESYGVDRISEIKTDITKVYNEIIEYFNDHDIPYNKEQENIFVKKKVTDTEKQAKKLTDEKDDKQEYKQTLNMINILQYEDKDYPYNKLLGLETEIGKLLNKKVWLKSGGFLVIEPTEAMVVIDVNTGKSIGKKNRDAHILKINIEAAEEVARQLRLRNLSGIIMVDFINMDSAEDKQKVVACLKREFAKDKVTTHFVEITKLDVFEITRKKQRRPIHEWGLLNV